MKLLKPIILATLTSSLLFATPATKLTKEEKQIKETIELGKKSSKILLETLDKNIKKHMEKDGVMKAFDFCSEEAFNITKKINKTTPKNVKIKRISFKYRSPANAPKSDEAIVLESFESMIKANKVLPRYLVKKVDSLTYKYYKPLIIKDKSCLECHGKVYKNIDLRRKVAEIYPLDRAIGYEMGDLRGAVVVTVRH